MLFFFPISLRALNLTNIKDVCFETTMGHTNLVASFYNVVQVSSSRELLKDQFIYLYTNVNLTESNQGALSTTISS